jgi:hypothetical protein
MDTFLTKIVGELEIIYNDYMANPTNDYVNRFELNGKIWKISIYKNPNGKRAIKIYER